jgi:hypothetical protein
MPRRQTSSSVPMLGTSTVIFRNSLGAPSSAQIVTRRLLRLPGSKALSFAWVIRKRTSSSGMGNTGLRTGVPSTRVTERCRGRVWGARADSAGVLRALLLRAGSRLGSGVFWASQWCSGERPIIRPTLPEHELEGWQRGNRLGLRILCELGRRYPGIVEATGPVRRKSA